jgi:hypothetical protein
MQLEHHGNLAAERGNWTCEVPPGLAFGCLEPMQISNMFPFSVVFVSVVSGFLFSFLLSIFPSTLKWMDSAP